MEEGEGGQAFVVEGRPAPEEEVEIDEYGNDYISEYNQTMELEEVEEIAATWPNARPSYYEWLDGARW